MADTVVYQDQDDITEQNLAAILDLKNNSDFVESGMGFNADFVNNEVTIGNTTLFGNHAIIRGPAGAYHVFPDQKTKGLATGSGVNHIFVFTDPNTNDSVGYHVDADDTPPSDPSIKIGTIDAGAETTTLLNRAPDADFGDTTHDSVTSDLISTDSLTVNGQPSELHWEEDDNSPLIISGTNTGTITLAGEYDEVKCRVTSTGGAGKFVAMRVNGDTGGNYTEIDLTGAQNTGQSQLSNVLYTGAARGQVIEMTGSWTEDFGVNTGILSAASTSGVQVGENTAVTSPLDSITFFQEGANNIELTVEVFGR